MTREEIEAERRWMSGLSSKADALCDLALIELAAVEDSQWRDPGEAGSEQRGLWMQNQATSRKHLYEAIAAYRARQGRQ